MNLLDALKQRKAEVADGRWLYRHMQVQKRAGAVSQVDVSLVLDDVEALIRDFAVLRIEAEAEIKGTIFSEAEVSAEVERARDRLLETARRIGGTV